MESTLIRVDLATKARLETLAGDMPLMKYLREVASRPGEEIESPLDALRNALLRRLDGIDATIEELRCNIDSYLGNMVEETSQVVIK